MTSSTTYPHVLEDQAKAALFYEARTANTFADEAVSDEQLRGIWDMARWAPTAANTQPLRVLFVRTPEGRERVAAHMSGNNQDKTRNAPAVAILAVDNRFHDRIPEILPFRPEMKDSLEGNEQMRTGIADFNSALQAGYFILATRAAGLAAGPMKGFDAQGIDGEFFADRPWHAVLVVNIGYPGHDAWMQRLPRLAHDDVLDWV